MIDVERVRVDIRRLALGDLSDIERIEHRVYPTPWSRSMFAGELAKPSSICLGAFDEEDRLAGYLIVSLFATRLASRGHRARTATPPTGCTSRSLP